ncbi:MAG TPA: UDP-3-O-acyl-N-acetylglucosamine deacetylase [Gemmatimonadales bacterium]|nr:UDP-3-O-acyl-N-acetylglucosamine deacetylase [Gemmatimonadales bacterium]
MPRRTLESTVELVGVGLHTGAQVTTRCCPAAAGNGIVFRRTDLPDQPRIPARLDCIGATARRTQLRRNGVTLDTVEHLLAAVAGEELDDLMVEVSGPELPILDGSFQPWIDALRAGGQWAQAGEPDRLRLEESINFKDGVSEYTAVPGNSALLSVTIEWPHPSIGRQSAELELTADSFRREIAAARTFGFASEVAALRREGLLKGATSECAVVLPEGPVNHGALRWPNEFARHKLGDLAGDLRLLGGRLLARIEAIRPSHRGNVAFAAAIARLTQPEGKR